MALKIGDYNTLEVLRKTTVGVYLGNEQGNDVLLPTKYVPEGIEIEDTLTVFVYLDNEERAIATTARPFLTINQFGLLRARDVNEMGAFLEWGVEKDLLVPFREQVVPMQPGKWYLVYLYMDPVSNRLVCSSKINRFLSNEELTVAEGDQVDLVVSHISDAGINVIVNGLHWGLIFKDQIYTPVKTGYKLYGHVSKIREGNKLDISIQAAGYDKVEPNSQKILSLLNQSNGFLAYSDNSSPEEIRAFFQMSKKTFKKAIGLLYKEGLITLEENGIRIKP